MQPNEVHEALIRSWCAEPVAVEVSEAIRLISNLEVADKIRRSRAGSAWRWHRERSTDPHALEGQEFTMGITTFPPGTSIRLHSHNTIEQVTVIEGDGIAELNGEQLVAAAMPTVTPTSTWWYIQPDGRHNP
jgi:hypothetical protein